MERRLKEIDKSLRELSHISSAGSTTTTTTTTNTSAAGQNSDENTASAVTAEMEYVRTTGNKLNKLWRRLTSQQFEKYDPTRRYKLCKSDLEQLYEEAKLVVLREFTNDEERITAELLEKSASNLSSSPSPAGNLQEAQISSGGDRESLIVPRLNLNFSSGQSEQDEESNTTSNTAAGANIQEGIYSPSVAEENFKAHQQVLFSTSDTENSTTRTHRLERNVQLFLALTKRIAEANGNGSPELQRSLSDTQLTDITDVAISKKSTTSHKNVASTSQTQQSSLVKTTSTNKSSRAIHRHSTSSSTELSNIPSVNSVTAATTETLENFSSIHQQTNLTRTEEIITRSTVICSSSKVTPPVPVVPAQPEGSHRKAQSCIVISPTEELYDEIPKKKSHLSSSSGTKEIEEISLQSNQLTAAHTFNAASSSDDVDESSITTEQSYSLNFENICTEEHLSGTNSANHWNEDNKTKNGTMIYSTICDNESFDSKRFKRNYSGDELALSNQSSTEKCIIDPHQGTDFVCNNETLIEDMSLPIFENTMEATQVEEEEEEEEEDDIDKPSEILTPASSHDGGSASSSSSTTLTPGNYIPDECKEPTNPINQAIHKERVEILPSPPSSISSQISVINQITTTTNNHQQYTVATATQLMPDIINELELRRHQLIIDHEHLRQYEHVATVPYMYVREIPNKPPPPYVPPAHGSPMTTIFPSEERIKDITYKRTHELYCELLKTDYCDEKGEKLPSVMDEQITNIYERITLDICREYLEQHSEILRDGDPINFHSQLAFFNPPNRLRCIQNAIYKEVRTCLAMDKTQPKRTQVYSVYGQRAKQDHIGKIIIQEMYDEDDSWCNFHREEKEVLELIVEEMINKSIQHEAKNILKEEGGEEVEEDRDEVKEIDEFKHSEPDQLQSSDMNRQSTLPSQFSSSSSSPINVEITKEAGDVINDSSISNEDAKLKNLVNHKDLKSLDSDLD
uniref:DUF4378 domain-containing protein n=1 Tax=Glossina brevipalpis TaxID=37001 RepID=A0A1A9X3L7_9MUSC